MADPTLVLDTDHFEAGSSLDSSRGDGNHLRPFIARLATRLTSVVAFVGKGVTDITGVVTYLGTLRTRANDTKTQFDKAVTDIGALMTFVGKLKATVDELKLDLSQHTHDVTVSGEPQTVTSTAAPEITAPALGDAPTISAAALGDALAAPTAKTVGAVDPVGITVKS